MLRPSNAQTMSPSGKRRAARARAQLARALEPYIAGVTDALIRETLEDWIRDDATTAILDAHMAAVRRLQELPRDPTGDIVDDLIAEEVGAQVPGLVEDFLREGVDAYLAKRRAETSYEAVYDELEAEWMPAIASAAVEDAKMDVAFDAVCAGAVEELSAAVVPEAIAEVAQQSGRDRKAEAERAVRETCETHVLRTASLRHLAGALGAKSTSVEVYRYLALKATALQVGRLDDALRRCVALRNRLENEPLLADGVRAAIADAGVELLQGQLRNALAAEEAALQRREDEAYGREPPVPASSEHG